MVSNNSKGVLCVCLCVPSLRLDTSVTLILQLPSRAVKNVVPVPTIPCSHTKTILHIWHQDKT